VHFLESSYVRQEKVVLDLPLPKSGTSYCPHPLGLGVVIMRMSNGDGNGGWHGRGEVMPNVDVS
jgi:hypothetical protein